MLENDTIVTRVLEDEMATAYVDYAMSVIVSRALPDVRDGLKPVHRRILFAMQDMGLWHNRAYKKSARLVGEVLGKYHPHGDSSVYDAMVRMAQPWSLRYPLVDGQGNYGSPDGDSAAAMRYTETRLAAIGHHLLRDIDKDTVDFVPNFDESLKEPSVVPTVIPTLLVNGSSGIAVGMATNVPPHNLVEAINALQLYIKNPDVTVDDIMKVMPAPDFPTGAIIYGYSGVREAYETGRGKIILRAKYHLEESKTKTTIVFTEFPYQVNKAVLQKSIADMRNSVDKDKSPDLYKALFMISTMRDESGRDGDRLIFEIKRDGVPEIVINQLFKHTTLQVTFGANILALVPDANGKLRPHLLPILKILKYFIEFRNEVIVRRTKYDLIAAWKRSHILEGFVTALDNIDEIIKIIRSAKNREDASNQLQTKFTTVSEVEPEVILKYLSTKQQDDITNYIPVSKANGNRHYLTKVQAEAILDMRIYRLTGLERDKIVAEYKEILSKIVELCSILDSKEKQLQIIYDELQEVKEKFGDARRTEIAYSTEDLTNEAFIVNEDVVITISHNGLIKRTPASTYRQQNKGGRGVKGQDTYEGDFVEHVFQASTHHYILFFTDKGKVYKLKVYDLPEQSRSAKGRSISNVLSTKEDGEKVTAYLPVKEFKDNEYIVMCTEKGTIKKTELSAFENVRSSGIIAIGLKDDDRLIGVKVTDGDCDIILGTKEGLACRFRESNVRAMGRTAAGVRGINLMSGDSIVSMIVIKRLDSQVLVVSERGYGKRTKFEDFRLTNRGGKGVISMNVTQKTGKVVRLVSALDTQDLIVITTNGILIRQPISAIRTIGRNTQGVKLIRLDDGDSIADITTIAHEETEDPQDIVENNTEA
ncbi:MAG: DNA gyrase subunit A [Ignavibacteria bacterium]|jgi:DNA gyrase subunit A|nr:DNA gyrase subunit A [Ignavibacteria bacterium]